MKNKDTKDFTFYSASRRVWSRTDIIWMTRSINPMVKKVEILPTIVLDHNPGACMLGTKKRIFKWRLNEELLEKKEI